MWPSNGYHGHGNGNGSGSFHTPANFQHSYSPDDGFIPFPAPSSGGFDQQFSPQAVQELLYTSDGEGYIPSFQPTVGLYNEGGLMQQNSYFSSASPDQFTKQHSNMLSQGVPRPALNARAEELKAQLIKKKEQRATSGTPPIITKPTAMRPGAQSDGTNSTRQSPKTPSVPSQVVTPTSAAQSITADDLEDLLSEAKAAVDVKQEQTNNAVNGIAAQKPKIVEAAKPHAKIQAQPANAIKSESNTQSKTANGTKVRQETLQRLESSAKKHEGIKDRPVQPNSSVSKFSEPKANPTRLNEQVLSNSQRETAHKTSVNPDGHAVSNESISNSLSLSLQRDDHRCEEVERRPEQQTRAATATGEERKHYESRQVEESARISQRRIQSDILEAARKPEFIPVPKKDAPPTQSENSTLEQLLLVDEDLKEWLDITGWNNAEYRKKTLNRRRAIAALDAQKAKLLEEMEREERGALLPAATGGSQLTVKAMPPPPLVLSTPIAIPISPIVKSPEPIVEKVSVSSTSAIHTKKESISKRTYNDYRDESPEQNIDKDRGDDRSRLVRMRSDIEDENRHPRPRSRPRSRDYPQYSPRYDDRAMDYTYNRGRGRGVGDSYGRELSPGTKALLSRQPAGSARSMSYDAPNDQFGRVEHNEPPRTGKSRPLVVRGNYRGRAFDPNYNRGGGGIGRGRGPGSSFFEREDKIEKRASSPERRPSALDYARRIDDIPPTSNMIKWERGGRGETRYFIVKSFNEENVVRCMQDSIWTTQIQNGEIFAEAFRTCRNVILVFSINKSRAFQGYARMENIPGSEPTPSWQQNINWETPGAFKVSWITIANTRFSRVGHLKNALNEGLAVLIGKDGQEIEEKCGSELCRLLDEEAEGQRLGF